MLSVSSETATSLALQAAQAKPVRPDPSQQNDRFGALVDSNVPVDSGNDRATAAARQQSTSQRRADDAAANADNTRSRDASAADQAAKNASDDQNNASAQQASDADAAANADADTTAAGRSKAKAGAAKADAAKTDEKQPSDTTAAADPASSAQQDPTPATTPTPVAVVIPITVAATDIVAAAPAPNATAPLAIAAAAIAASTAAGQAPAAPLQAKINSDAAAAAATTADAASAVATANDTAAATIAKTAAQAAAGATIAAKQSATPSDATATPESSLAAAAATTVPVAPKPTLLKAPVTGLAKISPPDTQGTNSGTSDPSATAMPASTLQTNTAQAANAVKPEAGADLTGAAKAEAANASVAAAPGPSAHDHSQLSATAHTSTDAADAGLPAGTIQQQLPAAAGGAAPAGAPSVAAATNTLVPVSGLALEIAASVRSGKSRFEIRLDPADLGRIDVRIDVDRNGQVTSHLTVEKPETLSMLRQDAPQLQRALDDAGFKTGDGGLQFSLRDQSSSGQNNGNDSGRNAQRLVISEDDTIPATVAGRTYGRVLGSSSGVDIRV